MIASRRAFSRPGAAVQAERPEYDPYITKVEGRVSRNKSDFIAAPLRQEIIALFWRHQGRWVRTAVVARALGYTDVDMVQEALTHLTAGKVARSKRNALAWAGARRGKARPSGGGRLLCRVRDGVREYQYATQPLFGS